MEEKELKERCERLFSFFDLLNDQNNSPYDKVLPVSHFIDGCGKLNSALPEEITNEVEENVMEVGDDICRMAFAIGFVIGQQFDLTYPDAQEDIEAIRKVIKEKALLPYLPREKKVEGRRTP